MAFLYRLSIIVAFLVLPTLLVNAQEDNGDPCESAALHEFDFWLGEWQVFDKETGKLIAYDRIEKDFGNCVVLQRWTSLDDTFRAESTPSRMRGMSLSGHNGNEWVQIWADNMGGTVVLRGGLDQGAMVLESKETSYGFYYRYTYAPQSDGSVHAFGSTAPEGTDEWTKDWDLVYKPNG